VSVIPPHSDCTARRMHSVCVLPEWYARGQASLVSNHGKAKGRLISSPELTLFLGSTPRHIQEVPGPNSRSVKRPELKLITHLHLLLRLTGLNYVSTPPICPHGVHDGQHRVLRHLPTWLQGLPHRWSFSAAYACLNAPPACCPFVNVRIIKWH
jgi:hypothetical protein